jgi:hypothetical protein
MALEEWADLVPEPAPGLSLGVLVALEEMVGEGEDVFAPLSQRRDVDAQHGDSIVEIFAKSPLANRASQVAMGRGHDPYVDLALAVGSHGPDPTFLEDPEELRLEAGRGLGDLIEEERALVGLLDEPLAVAFGPAECAANMPEELALEEGVGECGAVDGDEGVAAAGAALVDCAGDQLLAGAGLSGDEHRGARGGGPGRELQHVPHGAAARDEGRGGLRCRSLGRVVSPRIQAVELFEHALGTDLAAPTQYDLRAARRRPELFSFALGRSRVACLDHDRIEAGEGEGACVLRIALPDDVVVRRERGRARAFSASRSQTTS